MSRWRPSLRVLIAATIFAFGGIVLAVAIVQLTAAAEARSNQSVVEHAVMLASVTSQQLEGALRREEREAAKAATRGLASDRNVTFGALVNAGDTVVNATSFEHEGRPLADTPLASARALIERARRTEHADHWIDTVGARVIAVYPLSTFSARIGDPGSPASDAGVLVVMEDLRYRRAAARAEALGASLQAAALLLLLTLLAWRLLGGVVAQRLDQVVHAASRIERGDLSARAAVEGGDEIAVLGGAFDRMASRLEQSTATLSERETRFRRLVEFGSDIVLTLDAGGRVLYLGPSATRLYGWQPERVVGADVYSLVHPEDVVRLRPALEVVLREPGFTEPMLVRVRAGEGRWATMEAICHNPGDLEAGECVIVNARDATRRAELEEELRQAQKMEAVGRLAGGVAHDFNNLLTVILAGGEQLAERVDAESREEVHEILDAARRAAVLTQQLLTFSRRQTLHLEVIDTGETVGAMQSLIRRLLPAEIDVRVDVAGAPTPVLADAGQLSQVVLNLVVNAKDAMIDGGRLALSVHRERIAADDAARRHPLRAGEHAVLRVADTGAGMDAQTIDRIFEPFFTTKAEGRGTGLGLATSYGIVSQLGGAVEVESAVGVGTTFTILLPIHEQPAPDALAPRAAPAPRGTERLLVVEDDDALRALVSRMAARLGYSVQTAPHGIAALAILERETFDAVFTDVRMPKMNGIQFAAEARVRWPHLRFIFSSGFTSDGSDLDQALAAGGVFLPKPFSESELARALRSAIGGAA